MDNRLFAFVLMPFDKAVRDVYELGIKSACTELDIYCERVDDQFFSESILERIYNQIIKADIIISDMTGRNPNVFYETGFAHAYKKKVILLTKYETDIPFDLKHYSHIIYQESITTLRDELVKRLAWYKNNPDKIELPSNQDLEFYFHGIKIENGIEIKLTRNNSEIFSNAQDFEFVFQLDIHNPSNKLIDVKQRIGIITPEFFSGDNGNKTKTIKLPNKKYLHIYDTTGHPFYPLMWDSFNFLFTGDWGNKSFHETFSLKVYTEIEVKEISFIIDFNIADW